MNLRRPVAGEPHADLIDAVIDGYVAWREQSAAVTAAYAAWGSAGADGRAAAFADYCAALDREEWAAARYQWLVARVSGRPAGSQGAVDRAA